VRAHPVTIWSFDPPSVCEIVSHIIFQSFAPFQTLRLKYLLKYIPGGHVFDADFSVIRTTSARLIVVAVFDPVQHGSHDGSEWSGSSGFAGAIGASNTQQAPAHQMAQVWIFANT
jgi:hypothetical protein